MKHGSAICIFLVFFLIGCCTKKDCDFENYPSLTVHLQDFNDSRFGKVAIYDGVSNLYIDTLEFYDNSFVIKHELNRFDIRGKWYLIFSENRVDTISQIEFEVFHFKNSCNSCFLADGSSRATDFRNLTYRLNGVPYSSEQVAILP